MNATTLFSAYTKCFYGMMDARNARGNTFGIAVDSDPWARRFQKLQHFADLLEVKLEEILEEVNLRQLEQIKNEKKVS